MQRHYKHCRDQCMVIHRVNDIGTNITTIFMENAWRCGESGQCFFCCNRRTGSDLNYSQLSSCSRATYKLVTIKLKLLPLLFIQYTSPNVLL